MHTSARTRRIDHTSAQQLQHVAHLEHASYSEAEAASAEQLQQRAEHAPEFFLIREDSSNSALLGFVCGTLAPGEALTEESMFSHDPAGETLCMHSVVTRHDLRRTGIASELVRAFVAAARADSRPKRVKLICKDYLVLLYEKAASFESLGRSDVQHGGAQWIEMCKEL